MAPHDRQGMAFPKPLASSVNFAPQEHAALYCARPEGFPAMSQKLYLMEEH